MELKGDTDSAGITIVAMGSGSPDQASLFVTRSGFAGELYVSRDLAAYRAFGLFRGVRRTLGFSSLLRGLRALRQGFRQGSSAGDHWQQGGVFLIVPDGKVFFEHRDRFAGDHAAPDRVRAAIQEYLHRREGPGTSEA